ncbi:hypothetical protein [Kistimonas scapharcae]
MMKTVSTATKLIFLTALSILALASNAFADITIANKGAYVIERVCINDFDSDTCQKMSLPVGQSYTIPSNQIPAGGAQIGIEVLCAAYLVLPMADAQGITSAYVQDGEKITLNGICTYFGADSGATVMPQSSSPIDWYVKFK